MPLLERVRSLFTGVPELVDGGGPYVFWIFVSGVLLWTLVIERYWYFRRVLPGRSDSVFEQWAGRIDHASWSAHQIRKAMISRVNAEMTANLPLLRVLVPLSPLLGLVGTVSGMLEVFDSMALRGSADARTMASGVSHAMICTMTGLAVSITGLYPAHYFQTRSKRETEALADRLTF
jgi:biopolymer transport protein ExbB